MSMLAPLRHAPFRVLLAGRTIETFGNVFAPIALAFAVLDLTGSPRDLGLVVGIRTLANVIFLLFGGVLADRLPRHLLMVGSALVAAVTQGVVAALVLTGTATIPLLIGLSAVNGVAAALALPASAAIVPQTVPVEIRQQANGLSRLFFGAASILGAPLAGVVVAAIGPGWGIAIDAVTFVLAAACFALLRLPPGAGSAAPEARSGIVADLRVGWSEFTSRTWLWVVVAAACVFNMAWSGASNVLGPVVADQTFGRPAWGLILAAQTAGMLVGAVVAMRLRLRRLLLFGVFCCLFLAAPTVMLGLLPQTAPMMLAGFVAGLAAAQFGIAWETTMQEHVPADKLARVYSYDMVGSFVAMPLGEIVAGPVAEAVGVRSTLLGAGAVILLAVGAMLCSSGVRNLRHELPEPGSPSVKESVA